MISEEVKKALTKARLARNTQDVTILSTLLGEMMLKAVPDTNGNKIVSDNDAISVIKKSVKALDEMIELKIDDEIFKYEKSLIGTYLPSQLTESELRDIIDANCSGLPMSQIMTYLKENYSGRYDGKMASIVAKEKSTK